jgi:EF-P beta-lysylation protein EpmB
MITRTEEIPNTPDWQQQMATGFSDVASLLKWLQIDPSSIRGGIDSDSGFPLKLPLSFVRRMRRGDPEDPLLLQVLPTGHERKSIPGFVQDPVGDLAATERPGLIRKYNGRALLIATAACGIHCRYCFRRHFPYSDQRLDRDLPGDVLEALSAPDIEEAILSGGDPLTLSDGRLARLLDQLAGLGNLRRIRIHTRMPTLLPARVTTALADYLSGYSLPVAMVLHVNHANEYNSETDEACSHLRRHGVHLLNQAVLLKSVNDSVESLEKLCTRGYEAGILPYYVHQLDRVAGSAHFEVENTTAKELEHALRVRLPGYLVPRFVSEIPGELSKIPL